MVSSKFWSFIIIIFFFGKTHLKFVTAWIQALILIQDHVLVDMYFTLYKGFYEFLLKMCTNGWKYKSLFACSIFLWRTLNQCVSFPSCLWGQTKMAVMWTRYSKATSQNCHERKINYRSFKKSVDIYLLIGVELTEKYNWIILVQISGDAENVDISIKMETRDNLSIFTCTS